MSRYETRLEDYRRRERPSYCVFEGLQELVRSVGQLHNNWLYVNVDQWDQDPVQTPIYYLDEHWLEECAEDGTAATNEQDEYIPLWISDRQVQTWFELATFESIVEVLKAARQPVTIQMVIVAVKYYEQHDAYLDYEEVKAVTDLWSVLTKVRNHLTE
ncbi:MULTISPECIES: DUF7716 domain-containing protein [Paenibacillus]|uniref:DUF7716 domain-containing protein n=1 Tax=Paenibacillus TaxID=44249 RepID=UPI0005CE8829|nr:MULTISPECIES: hypothetical protein [Paenibacillus]KAF6582073.1 hypothetical protein G9G57_19170 [Paenibacillus sp. EKM211P]KJD41092.1 hypothetical protein QD46_03510 [Paenibacillus polymyxa]RFT96514.1 hypothetical protein DX902_14800 [Paenibacillus jamilae]WOZ40046.1 hypothetical protein RQP19_08395 [Paenibacillus polymyxa]